MIDSSDHQEISEELIKQGIENQEFYFNYQPICDLKQGKVIKVEALARWCQKSLNAVAPSQFIPIVARHRIIDFHAYLLAQVKKDSGSWTDIKVTVNLSPKEISHPQIRAIYAALPSSFTSRLEVEITEDSAISNEDVSFLHQLKEQGIKIAIDDYGTGYSCFQYLCNLPIDSIKIDRSLIEQIDTNPKQEQIVKAGIVDFAQKTLGISVVAEGIERAEQLKVLQNMNCNLGQGYYFHQAMTAELISKILQTESSNA